MAARGTWQRACRWIGVLVILVTGMAAGQPAALAADDAPPDPSASQVSCRYGSTHRTSQVRDAGVREASALVASQRWPGIYWTLNDSKNAAVVYAFDQDGQPRGSFRVSGASNVDWEAMQLGPDGTGGYALYVGDVGDNDFKRGELVIYRVPEPAPGPPGTAGVRDSAPATPLRFVYPGGPHNTEAMLVHPETGEILVITREISGVSLIYRLPLPATPETTMLAELVDVLDVRTFDTASNQVTDGAVSSDGKHVVLRTYGGVLTYDVPASASLERVSWQEPRVYRLSDGAKGEGITYRLNSNDLMTVGEETPAALYETPWEC